ncbi:MAG TPA: Dabb family protein [Streptosporangiaceae bacterium]|jgi:hypothetical protein|nr:Dabb family protein [Streptosporangiaceae bacterium]
MLRHVVLFDWIPQATDQQKKRVTDELRTLPPLMTGLRSFLVGPDAAIVDGNYSFAVVADFDDAPSYLAYRGHPAHRAIVEQVINPITRQRAGVQYEI